MLASFWLFWSQELDPAPGSYSWIPFLLGGYSAQAIKEYMDYELKSANNPYVLTNFCKLLSLTYSNDAAS